MSTFLKKQHYLLARPDTAAEFSGEPKISATTNIVLMKTGSKLVDQFRNIMGVDNLSAPWI